MPKQPAVSSPSSAETVLTTLRDYVRWGASRFTEAGLHFGHGTDTALDEAFHLVTNSLGLPHDLPAVYLEAVLTLQERRQVIRLLRERVKTRKPAAYLIGHIHFAGLPFKVDERVIVPRSPIGEMIERQFQPWLNREPRTILDLCAGSGCIGIACADYFPEATVDLAELSKDALQVIASNIALHDVGDRVTAYKSDLFGALAGKKYDLIVCNPPYVPTAEWKALPQEFKREPRMSLDGGDDGMDVVARLLAEAADHLNPGSVLICEIGGSQAQFQARFPELQPMWPDFERGGDGVFVLTREELAPKKAPAKGKSKAAAKSKVKG